MNIRAAETSDIDFIMPIFETAKEYMRKSGNKNQWVDGYPQKELILNDINKKQFFVMEDEDDSGKKTIHGCFAFIIGEEPSYRIIEDGSWKDDSPYGTIHRIASDGKTKGIMSEAVKFCMSKISHLRADTHKDNKTMQHILQKLGFEYRGIIYISTGNPRLAFEL